MATAATVIYQNNGLQPATNPEEAKTMCVRLPGGVDYPAGQVLGARTGAAASDVQTITITGTPTGGGFYLTFNGYTTGLIDEAATAAEVVTALEALANIGSGGVTATGGALPGSAVVVTFAGALASRKVPLMTTSHVFTGGTNPSVVVTQTTAGSVGQGQFEDYDDAASDGTQTAKAILVRRTRTNELGQIINDVGQSTTQYEAAAYVAGTFHTASLTGIDANGVADLGKLITGNTSILTATTTLLRMG